MVPKTQNWNPAENRVGGGGGTANLKPTKIDKYIHVKIA